MILKIKKSISFLVLLLAFVMTGTPIIVDSILIIMAGVLALFLFFKEKNYEKIFLKTYFPLFLFYLVLLIGLIYSENISKSFNQLEKKLTFIILPIIFYTIRHYINTEKIIKYFSFGVLFSSLICDVIVVFKYKTIFTGYTTLLQSLDIDPTYFSMYCLFAMTFFYETLLKTTNTKIKIAYLSVFIYLAYFFLRVGSKIGLILIFVIIIYTLLKSFRKKTKKTNYILFTILIMFALLSYFLPITYNRFYAPLIDNKLDFYQLRMKFFNERYYAWKCSLEALNIKYIWLGYGTGDDLGVLKECYESFKRTYTLNSHNIYFSSLLKNGFLGLLSLLFVIIQGFKTSKIQYIIFSLIIIFTGFTESIFERQKGIIFFTFICTLILTELLIKKENKCVEL
ncbi:O-antigen ligase family protein [Pontimicrobium sp. MEBiC01747]